MTDKKKYFLILVLFMMSFHLVWAQQTKMLFLGNSYTGANDLADKVDAIALSLGDSIYYDTYTPGGYTIKNHAQDENTLAKIAAEDWDFILVQAQSQELSLSPSYIETEVSPYAMILKEAIQENNPCSEMVMFMTWGRKYGDQQNCSQWPPVCNFLGMQHRLMVGAITIAEQNEATIAPVGLAWKYSMDQDMDSLIHLYSNDYSHPSLSGTYLSACVIYATLFQNTPLQTSYNAGLPEEEADYLRHIAYEVALEEEFEYGFYDEITEMDYQLQRRDWFDDGNIAIAGFSYLVNAPFFHFTDHSMNAMSYLWDFGDGENSNLSNPIHAYTEAGEYLVKQTVFNDCFQDEYVREISILTQVDGAEPIRFDIYPSPAFNQLNISLTSGLLKKDNYCEIYDTQGKVLWRQSLEVTNNRTDFQIDISELSAGVYYVQINSKDQKMIKKIMIQ